MFNNISEVYTYVDNDENFKVMAFKTLEVLESRVR